MMKNATLVLSVLIWRRNDAAESAFVDGCFGQNSHQIITNVVLDSQSCLCGGSLNYLYDNTYESGFQI